MFNRKKPLRKRRRSCRFTLRRSQFGLSMSSIMPYTAAVDDQYRQ